MARPYIRAPIRRWAPLVPQYNSKDYQSISRACLPTRLAKNATRKQEHRKNKIKYFFACRFERLQRGGETSSTEAVRMELLACMQAHTNERRGSNLDRSNHSVILPYTTREKDNKTLVTFRPKRILPHLPYGKVLASPRTV